MSITPIQNRSRKAVLVVILLIVVCSAVVATYAEVGVSNMSQFQGTVTYSPKNAENGMWSTTLTISNPSDQWYSRLEINSAGCNRHVTVIWQLQQKTDFSSWTAVSGAVISTSITLSGGAQNVYATYDGAYSSSNHDWGQNAVKSGTYRVVATLMA
jgi:hypothetical protein